MSCRSCGHLIRILVIADCEPERTSEEAVVSDLRWYRKPTCFNQAKLRYEVRELKSVVGLRHFMAAPHFLFLYRRCFRTHVRPFWKPKRKGLTMCYNTYGVHIALYIWTLLNNRCCFKNCSDVKLRLQINIMIVILMTVWWLYHLGTIVSCISQKQVQGQHSTAKVRNVQYQGCLLQFLRQTFGVVETSLLLLFQAYRWPCAAGQNQPSRWRKTLHSTSRLPPSSTPRRRPRASAHSCYRYETTP